MHIEFNEDQVRALLQTLLSEISTQKALLNMEESSNESAWEALILKNEEITKLKAELKALKPVKRGRGRPKKATA